MRAQRAQDDLDRYIASLSPEEQEEIRRMSENETVLTAGVTIEERTLHEGERTEDVVCVRFYLANSEVRETWFAVEDMHQIARYWMKRHPILSRTGGRQQGLK